MNLDIRLPIGGLFTLLGLLLTGYGLMADASIYRRSLGHNAGVPQRVRRRRVEHVSACLRLHVRISA